MAFKIVVLINQPLKKVLGRPDVAGRLVGWAVELGEHDIEYQPRTAIKGQVVADFIAETTEPIGDDDESSLEDIPEWTLYVDGSATEKRSGAGIVLITPDKVPLSSAVRFGFKASNNEAEYEALLAGLRLANELGARRLKIFSDSQLIVGQVLGDFSAREENMNAYLQKVEELLSSFAKYKLEQIPREMNENADALARLASATDSELGRLIPAELLSKPSAKAPEQVLTVQSGAS